MPGLHIKPLKRFIICYKKNIEGVIIKQPPTIIKGINSIDAAKKACTRSNIPFTQVSRTSDKEGYIYSNEVYNPADDEEQDG